MAKVSVCLLTYNRAKLLPKVLETILAQTLCDFELIISDNCSIDETAHVCRNFEKKDGRVRYFRNNSNLGMTANYQAAIERCTGAYVAFLHDDDLYHSNLLSKWLDALERFPSAAFVFNSTESIGYDGQHIRYWFHSYPLLIQPGRLLLDDILSHWGSPVRGTVMVRREHVSKVGTFDFKRFPNIGDVDMWMRLASMFDVVYIKEPLIQVMERDSVVQNAHFAQTWPTRKEQYDMYRLNICRRYADKPVFMRKSLKSLNIRRIALWCRLLLGQARRGQFDRIFEFISMLYRLRPSSI